MFSAISLQSEESACVTQRSFFTRLLAFCYLSAFSSHYVQIAGLWSHDGLLPVSVQSTQTLLESAHKSFLQTPTLLLYSRAVVSCLTPLLKLFGVSHTSAPDVDTMLYLICLMGTLVAFAAVVSERCANACSFFVLWMLYLSMFTVGQTFLSFQWDTLLLEVGLITVIYARLPFIQPQNHVSLANVIGRELVRWLAFRLLFSSGVVKLLSGCPTWWSLSALFYHFETQCLPTPLSWYFHQLPHVMQHLGAGFTYFAMIFCSWLFFSPLRSFRRLGVLANVGMQALILVSGNYNFFNLLTIALCDIDRVLVVCDDKDFREVYVLRTAARALGATLVENPESVETTSETTNTTAVSPPARRPIFPIIRLLFSLSVCLGFLIWTFTTPLPLSSLLRGQLPFAISHLRKRIASTTLAYAFCIPSCFLLLSCLRYIASTLRPPFPHVSSLCYSLLRLLFVLPLCVLGIALLAASFVPFSRGIETTHTTIPLPYVNSYQRIYEALSPLSSVHSYGLFRRMTGVGGRPELIIQGSSDGIKWKDYVLPYKPQALDRNAVFNIPHQPRLDWQMWFAALTDQPNTVWIFSLAQKLFSGSESVHTLFASVPFPSKPPDFLRIQLYQYNFTVVDSHPWSKLRQKPAVIDDLLRGNWPNNTWTRRFQKDWLPAFHYKSENLLDVFRRIGLTEPEKARKVRKGVHPLHFLPIVPVIGALGAVWLGGRALRWVRTSS